MILLIRRQKCPELALVWQSTAAPLLEPACPPAGRSSADGFGEDWTGLGVSPHGVGYPRVALAPVPCSLHPQVGLCGVQGPSVVPVSLQTSQIEGWCVPACKTPTVVYWDVRACVRQGLKLVFFTIWVRDFLGVAPPDFGSCLSQPSLKAAPLQCPAPRGASETL